MADLNGADLTRAELAGATVELDDWMDKLDEWGVRGAERIRENYKIVFDTSGNSRHRLEKRQPKVP